MAELLPTDIEESLVILGEQLNETNEAYNNIATISVSDFVTVTTPTVDLISGTAHCMNNVALVTGTLPAIAQAGAIIVVNGRGVGGWKIAQRASQSIIFGGVTTTVGTDGWLASDNQNDCVTLRCLIANTTWTVETCMGNIDWE